MHGYIYTSWHQFVVSYLELHHHLQYFGLGFARCDSPWLPSLCGGMERGRDKRSHVLFAFDFQVEHISAFLYLHDVLGHVHAAKLVMALTEQFEDVKQQGLVYELAVRNPATAAGWIEHRPG